MTEVISLSDLALEIEKWQASSHPQLTNRQPEELFDSGFVECYRRLHYDLWKRIIRLHGTIHTLEQLEEFPFNYLYATEEMQFWRLVVENFLESAIVFLHGLVNDAGQDVHSLGSFCNQIFQARWLCQEKRELFIGTMRERKFDGFVKRIAMRVDRIRHNYVAHRLFDKETGKPKEKLPAVSLEEIRRLFDAAHSLFGALSFGAAFGTLAGDLLPCTIGGKRPPTCLDKVLDAVLRDSDFVKRPEQRLPWWPEQRKLMKPETLRVMNDLRRRIGLPEA